MERKYKVVNHIYLEAFTNLVNQYLEMGWECIGGVTQIEVDANEKTPFPPLRQKRYAQAMSWEEKESTPTTQQNNTPTANVTQIDQERIAA